MASGTRPRRSRSLGCARPGSGAKQHRSGRGGRHLQDVHEPVPRIEPVAYGYAAQNRPGTPESAEARKGDQRRRDQARHSLQRTAWGPARTRNRYTPR